MIREYRVDDLATVLAVWTDASSVGHPFLNDDFLAAERKKVAEVYLPNAETWVWEVDGSVVGFISLVADEIGGLFVDPTHHGGGIGSRLVDHVRGLRNDLEVEVFKDNSSALSFYRSCGFVPYDEQIHEETGLAVIRLRLASVDGSEHDG